MLRKNIMSALLAAVATGAVLVAYNAFLQKSSSTQSATSKISEYLQLDKTKQETKADENNVAGTDNAASVESLNPVTVTENPSTDQAQSSAAEPSAGSEVTSTPTVANAADSRGDKVATTYVVREGDTYGCIAEMYYGSFEHYTDIMESNPVAEQGFGEYTLFAGATLTLPSVSKADLKPASSLCQ